MCAKMRTIEDVVAWRMCVGCGACSSVCPNSAISLYDDEARGIRPVIDESRCDCCGDCLPECPGYQVDAASAEQPQATGAEGEEVFGPAIEIWQGWASDPEIRHRASSGGALTALGLYCIERGGMDGVVHSGPKPEAPWRNGTGVSRSREDLMSRAGSRYAPASPCDGLRDARDSEGVYAFIGKPCDTAAATKTCARDDVLDKSIGAIFTHFCAGTPSTRASVDLIRNMGAEANEVTELHHRGFGWPGGFRFRVRGEVNDRFMPYAKAWDRMYVHVPLRCRLCADGFGRVADISCGDAWHDFNEDDPGRSVILVRTERGKRILDGAVEAGYLTLTPADASIVKAGQENLIKKHRQVYGRLMVLRWFGVPVTKYPGFDLKAMWRPQSFYDKRMAIIGTLSRVIKRGFWRKEESAS